MARPYKRVLLKLSGEVLAGGERSGLNYAEINGICEQIQLEIGRASCRERV